jgi:ribose transport system ATP-binding protein
VGANGSGKSTLVKALAGYHRTVDAGEVLLDGEPHLLPLSPDEVMRKGIRFVHQDLGLVDQMAVVDNVCLYAGYERAAGRGVDWARSKRRAVERLAELGLHVAPETPVSVLGPAERVILAVARATSEVDGRGTIVLDEPTAAIPVQEVARIMGVVRARRDEGWGILYISHRLDEVLDLSDRVSVLRDGRLLLTEQSSAVDAHELARLVAGDTTTPAGPAVGDADQVETRRTRSRRQDPAGASIAEAVELHGRILRGVTLNLAPGEIVGVTGPAGCGKSELGRIFAGAESPQSGFIALRDTPMVLRSPRHAQRMGVGYVPQDRIHEALLRDASVRENISGFRLAGAWRRGWLSVRRERAAARAQIKEFGVVPARPELAIASLSGGNQQKCVLARAAAPASALLVLDDPTAGVDVAARAHIHRLIEGLADRGIGVLLLSTEMEELERLADRVLVLRRGLVTAEHAGESLTPDRIAESVFAGTAAAQEPHLEETS